MSVKSSDKLKTIFELLLNPKEINALISQKYSGYLVDIGWFNSYKTKQSINALSKPIPRTTYPFIDFIVERLNKEITLFEYGSGNSTLFWAERVKEVNSVEHSSEWFKLISDKTAHLKNVEIKYTDAAKDSYSDAIKLFSKKYDFIMVDAIYRIDCMKASLDYLTKIGVVILDDSEREEYREGIEFIVNNGFRRIDFWGIAPTILFKKCTTIFYRNNNCLGI
jgi:hypothetical protein